MTIYEFFEHNKDYKPWVTIRDYLSGEYLFRGWVASIPCDIGCKAVYRWANDKHERYDIYIKE